MPPYPSATSAPGRGWRLPFLAALLTLAAVVPGSAPAAVAWRPEPGPVASLVPVASPVPVAAPALGPGPSRVPDLWMPVAGALVRGFDARAGPYGPGHRGVDIAAAVGETVRAPAAGRVVFAGQVAGTTWVSILVEPGVVVTLGPLLDPVADATQVRSRDPVGRAAPGHPGAAGGVAVHLGVRVDGVYVDPLGYLVDRPRPRLAPLLAPGGRSGG
jgi:murein DD-endopeptidase MepM/ murein hydrolase activator NlpD